MFPHHPPEIIHSIAQWPLCCNICLAVLITLYRCIKPLLNVTSVITYINKRGIDIVRPSFRNMPQSHTICFIYENVKNAV